MKKRILSWLLVIAMVLGIFPVTAFAAEQQTEQGSNYITVSIEKYDVDGNGSVLLNPKRLLKEDYVNDYVHDALRQAMGGYSYVKMNADTVYSVTGVYDPKQNDSYLNNGDLEGYQWQVLLNNEAWNGIVYNTEYKLKGGDVIRCIYTNETAAGQTDKDALVQLAGEVSDEVKQKDAYQNALDTIVDRTASESDVNNAISALQNAMVVNAASVEITAGDSTELMVNRSAALEATVLPANTTEELVWSSSDSSIVSVDAESGLITGIAAGTAWVTVTCGSVSDSIQVNVTAVEATGVTITNGDVSVEARFSVQLRAAVTPKESTELVTWSVGDENIASVDASGKLTGNSAGTTTVTATAGSVSDTVNVTVTETSSPYVYFQYSDGRVQEMKDDTFTLTVLDEGSFVVGNTLAAPDWDCQDTADDGSGGYQYRYWINTDGKYQPHEVKKMTATVQASGYYKTFTINTVSSEISQLKAYIDGQERNEDNSYSVTGIISGVPVTVKGLNGNGDWIDIPTQAVAFTSGNTNIARFLGNQMSLIYEGSTQITISMLDDSNVSASFTANCNTVQVTGIDVHVPDTFIIDKWDNGINTYIGVTEGYSNPDTEYYVVYTPNNATNQDLIWEDLDSEIAEFHETWSAGIVPKKAGTARFKVTSVSNPNVSQEVSVTFEYKVPLENVVNSQENYEIRVGESIEPKLTFEPANATETRFNWTYSQDGIVQVQESVSIVGGFDAAFSRKIKALSEGTVTVTGTPFDDSKGCQPVVFTVTVSGSGQTESIDYLEMAKKDLAHGLKYLQQQSQASYGDEWTIFTNLRAGGSIDMQQRIIYLQSVADEMTKNTSNKQPTDYVRLVLTLPLLGVDPENFEGFNFVETLYNNTKLENHTSNQYSWTLLALDSRNYEIPENALWTREKLIEKILTFQNSDGGFAMSAGSYSDVDITGMILQALATYNNDSYPEVQSALEKSLEYLKGQMTENVGYINGGAENSCTAAQVLTALAALGIDPVDADNGFTFGTKNLITNLRSFKQEDSEYSGFAYLLGADTNIMGTQQITYALEAYRRLAENENFLYDLTDLDGDSEPEEPTDPEIQRVTRIFGEGRIDTAFEIAETLKTALDIEKFETVIIATSKNFADALPGSYLAYVENAPILLVSEARMSDVVDYVKENLAESGKIYILGGTAAVPAKLDDLLKDYDVKRLAGSSRYDTNLMILEEANVAGGEIIVATGREFADSLSVSAVKLPILLVKDQLNENQKAFLEEANAEKFYIAGGEAAVNKTVEEELDAYGAVERIAGANRRETSVKIAEKFFENPKAAVVASARNFPDGLCGGPLAAALDAPLLLTVNGNSAEAEQYADAIDAGYVLGGKEVMEDQTVMNIFDLESADDIITK